MTDIDDSVRSLSVLNNGLLAITSQNNIEIWNASARTRVRTLTGHQDIVVSLQTIII